MGTTQAIPAGVKAVAGLALWLCACNLLSAVAAAQCSNPTQIPNQTINSGTVAFADNNALRAASVVISGSASVTFVAGNCIELAPGFRATAGSAATTFHAWVQTVPTADSVSPASGSGLSQQFTWKASSPSGYANLAEIQALFNTSTSGQNACYIRYNRASNLLYLRNNAGTSWSSGIVPGGSGTASNSQCGISGTGSSVSGAGNQLTLTVAVTFQTGFSGTKNDYLIAYDNAGLNSGWRQVGTWTVSSVPAVNHTVTTTPPGLSITIDGTPCTSPCIGQWQPGTSHTIASTFRQQLSGTTYYFSSWSDSGTLSHQVTAQSSPTTYTAAFSSNALQAFRSCLDSSNSTTCTLAQGEHTVAAMIAVGRSNVTIAGETGNRSETRLLRDPGYTGRMMQVDAASPLTGITIQNLTFCGNNNRYDAALYVNNPFHSRVCPIRVPSQPTACDNSIQSATCVDLALENADTGQYPTSWSYSGPYSVTISNCAFEDATGHAIAIHPTAPKKVNDVYIHDTDISGSAVTGILGGVNSTTDYNDRKLCDSYPNFDNDPNVPLPRNIRLEGNTFYNNNTGSIGMLARWIGLRNSTFVNNYIKYAFPALEAGGSVFFDQCSDRIQITGNTLTGPANANTSGLELWGRNITVDNNTISNYPTDGIDGNSVFNTTITNNRSQNNTIAGILVWTAGPGGGCGQIMRDTQTVTVSGNTSTGQNYGILLGDRGLSRNTINGLTIAGNNTLQPNTLAAIWLAPIVALNGYSGPAYSTDPSPPPDAPRSLAIDAVSPGTSRCSVTGYRRQTFKFAASDMLGAANVRSIEVIFSIPGNDETGDGGPGGPPPPPTSTSSTTGRPTWCTWMTRTPAIRGPGDRRRSSPEGRVSQMATAQSTPRARLLRWRPRPRSSV